MPDGYASRPYVPLPQDELLFFVGRALRGMSAIVTSLGDEMACRRPDIAGANTPYGLLTHCLGVAEYWAGAMVAGRQIVRDRAAEFTATGSVTELADRVEAALAQFARDLADADPLAPLRSAPQSSFQGPDRPLTQAGALMHVYEELAQHHGQMEVLRDALLAETGRHSPQDSVAAPLAWLRAKQGVKWHRPGPGLIPAWVADMDFPVAPAIAQAIDAAVHRGDLGYPDWPVHPLAEPFSRRMRARYGWDPEPGHVRGITDLIQAFQITMHLMSEPGDGVVAFVPNYPPFLAAVESMRRRLVPAGLYLDGRNRWTWDHDRLDRAVTETGAKILLLVDPHNPTGKVFTDAELASVAAFAERHDLLVISDEIHAELTYSPARHRPFATISDDAARRTVTVTSASKAFNIAGLRAAVAHVGHERLRRAWDAQPHDLFGATNVLGVEATLAAWARGDGWLDRVREHLHRQRDELVRRVEQIPGITMVAPEAGYLAWLDCGGLGLGPDEPPAGWLRTNAGLELSAGPEFGPGNEHRVRINFATSTELLGKIVDRIEAAVRSRDSAATTAPTEPAARETQDPE